MNLLNRLRAIIIRINERIIQKDFDNILRSVQISVGHGREFTTLLNFNYLHHFYLYLTANHQVLLRISFFLTEIQ